MADVVALSGGKDSTAMALRLAEVEPRDYTYLIGYSETSVEIRNLFS